MRSPAESPLGSHQHSSYCGGSTQCAGSVSACTAAPSPGLDERNKERRWPVEVLKRHEFLRSCRVRPEQSDANKEGRGYCRQMPCHRVTSRAELCPANQPGTMRCPRSHEPPVPRSRLAIRRMNRGTDARIVPPASRGGVIIPRTEESCRRRAVASQRRSHPREPPALRSERRRPKYPAASTLGPSSRTRRQRGALRR